jgi:glutathione synthase/RimK-type ligase-like ATP-grasp enzyme
VPAIVRPRVLLISNKFDYSTDHVAYQLHGMGVPYLRLNRDQFAEMRLELLPAVPRLRGSAAEINFDITAEALRSVYFRAPVFLRETFQPDLPPDDQLARGQWAAFLRSLTVFDRALWLNHPRAIYQAEVKPFQLKVAAEVGFPIPETVVTNSVEVAAAVARDGRVVVKTLDSVVLKMGSEEGFIYTNFISTDEVLSGDISAAPVIAQQPLVPKVDLRVTVVGRRVFPVEITSLSGEGCRGDWRTQKNDLVYRPNDLPEPVAERCVEVVRRLGLRFGGIDLILHGGDYYFVEVNPTGEWAWLMGHAGFPIDLAIAEMLCEGHGH